MIEAGEKVFLCDSLSASYATYVKSYKGLDRLRTPPVTSDPLFSEEVILKLLTTLATNEIEVFLTVTWKPNITLHTAIHMASTIQKVADTGWITIEPPPTNTLYYRAFLPDPQHRDRSKRLEQPWELHISTGDIPETATAVWIEETWPDDAEASTLTAHETVVTSGEELESVLAGRDGLPVILVYAPSHTTVGGLMRFLSPCLDTHSTVYVFEEQVGGVGDTSLPHSSGLIPD